MKTFSEQEIKNLAKETGWSEKQVKNGYDVFECCGGSSVIDRALIVERIDDVEKFESDFEACRQAEKDGIKFINDIDDLEKGCYIDTLENRKHCIEMLEKHPEYRIENLMDGSEYWNEYREYVSSLQ